MTTLVVTAVAAAIGFAGAPRHARTTVSSRVAMLGADDIATAQADSLSKIESGFTLSERDFADSLDCASWSQGDWKGDIKGWAGEPKLGWVTSGVTHGPGGACSAELSAWVAPSYDLPHLLQRIELTAAGELELTLDYIARYDLPSDPQYLQEYYFSIAAWRDEVIGSVAGAALSTAQPDVFTRCISSPMKLSLVMPGTDEALAAAKAACVANTERWVGWWEGVAEVNRMKRGGLFSRDTKMHRMRFQSHSDGLSAAGLDAGLAERVAQALVGPGDEQYVGQAS